MKFLELNKKRHATKHFIDKPVDPKDVRTAIEIATLAPPIRAILRARLAKSVSVNKAMVTGADATCSKFEP